MVAIDTNVLVRLLTRDDPRQAAVADAFVARGAWISHLVLVETAWVLSSVYDRTPRAIATAFGMLLDHATITVEDPDVVRSALTHFRGRRALGFSDCLLLELARKSGHLPLGTFDRELGKLAGTERL
ncbi:MAG: type II toxin-antitoxin system VapC family toxin [Candidatus Binatia bacterium]